MAHTFDRLIIDFFMSYNQAFRQPLTTDCIAMILTSKVNSACRNFTNCVVEATVAELHLMRLCTVSHGEEPTSPSTTNPSTTTPTTDPSTTPGITEPTNPTPSTPEPKAEEPSTTDPTSKADEPKTTVPTINGGTATVTPNTNVPTNNPNVSAQTAANAGASQVGTTSQVTGQIVSNVSTQEPVYTNTGYQIVSTQNSQVVVAYADGSTDTVAPETIGATVNEDKTISVQTASGEMKTLPSTGEKGGLLASLSGVILLALAWVLRKKNRQA